jgi:hypothetical protein
VTSPEDAVRVARERAAGRAPGANPTLEVSPSAAFEAAGSSDTLLELALVEPDPGELRSTRRAGAAVTGIKLVLVRLLSAYHASLLGGQARFNVEAASQIHRLERRIEELERRLGEQRPPA